MTTAIGNSVGVIGLGIIGAGYRDICATKDCPVFVWNRTPRPVPNFVGAPAELAECATTCSLYLMMTLCYCGEPVDPMASSPHHCDRASHCFAPHTMREAAADGARARRPFC